MMRRTDFRTLQSLTDVKAERIRIEMEIDRAKERLERDYERIDSYFTVAFYVNKLKEKLVSLYSLAESARKGYDTVMSMIHAFQQKRTLRKRENAEQSTPSSGNEAVPETNEQP